MPAQLLKRAVELAEDPDVLSLVPNLNAVDAQLAVQYERLSDPTKAAAWATVRDVADRMGQAVKGNRPYQMGLLYVELRKTLEHGESAAELEADLLQLHEIRRKLVDTEARRLSNEHSAVSYDRAMGVVLLLVDIMFRHVHDRETRRRIIDDVRAIVAAPDTLP